MMSLGVAKGGVIPPTDEDRRRIIRQMKVRTTLKGDKSWIHHHNSDSEEEKKKSSPLSRQAGRGSPGSTPTAPQGDRSAAAKPQAGYLIRGVFTRTIDKSSSVSNSSPSNEVQKSTATKGQSLSRPSSGYRMTTEDYKKLAPYNVKQKPADTEEEDAPFSPDEHKKRTEAANSVLRSSASRERAYVLSAAKKSNGSPTQEFPPLFAKRIEIEEEEGQQRRSSAVSGSCRSSADDNSPERGSESPRATSLSDTPERISTGAEFRNGDTRQAPRGRSSSEMVTQHGEGDKPLKEKAEPFPWDDLAPRAPLVSSNRSYSEHTEVNNGVYPPKDSPAEASDQLHLHCETSQGLEDAKAAPARSSLLPPPERAPVHLEEREYSFKRSVLGYEERSSSQGSRSSNPEAPAPSKPYWSEARSSQDFKEGNTPRDRRQEQTWPSDECKPELTPGFLDSSSHSEKGQEPPAQDAHPEPPNMPGSSSLPRESSITAPETPGKEGDPCQERSNFSSKESAYETQHFPSSLQAPSHRIPAYVDSQMLSSRRPTPDYEGRVYDGRSSPRSSRYDSTGAWAHCEFNSPAARHDSFPRDTTMSMSPRSHRVPFYMDSLNYNSTRLLSSSSERLCSPMATLPHSSSATSGYQPEPSTAGKGLLFVKEYVNSSGLAASPRYTSGSLVDLNNLERGTYSHHSYLASTPLQRSMEPLCSYCSREIRDCPKIIIEHLNIYCHEYCFRCGICHKAMGDLLDKIFIHRDIVHCDKCYEKLF